MERDDEPVRRQDRADRSLVTPGPPLESERDPRLAKTSALAILAGALVFTFVDLLSTSRLPAYRDLLGFSLPLKHYLAERLRGGSIPLWNPWILLGTPFFANLQSAVLYPPTAFLLIDFPLGLNLFLLAHYVIACSGAWMWLRDRRLGVTAAAIGASVFSLGGYLVSVMNLTNHLQGSAWAPWALFVWGRHVRLRSATTLATFIVTICVQFLGGSPESLLITLTVLACWTLYDRAPRWAEVASLAVDLALALALVAGLCAIQILPTIEYLGQSVRAGPLSWGEVSFWSLQPVSLLQLLFPHSSVLLPADEAHSLGSGFENKLSLLQSLYIGIGPLCLAVCGLTYGRERRFWSSVVGVAMILALGQHTPVFRWLYDAIPTVFGRFRYPEKFFLAVHLGLTIAVAEGAQCVTARRTDAERTLWIAVAVFASVAGLFCVLRWTTPLGLLRLVAILSGKFLPLSQFVTLALDVYRKAQRLLLILAALGAIVVLRRHVLGETSAKLLLAALVAVDLASANRDLNVSLSWHALQQAELLVPAAEIHASRRRIYQYQVVDAPGGGDHRLTRWFHSTRASDDLSRTYFELWRALYANAGIVHKIGNVSGGDGIARASDAALLEVLLGLPIDRGIALLATYGAGYLIGPDLLDAPGLEPIPASEPTPYHAYRIRNSLPLVYAASRLEVAPDLGSAFQKLISPGFQAGEEALVEALPPGWKNGEGSEQSAARVELVEHSPEIWRIVVDAPSRTFLVVNESFFPGWTATVDSTPASVYRVNAIVRGLPIEPGRHQIEFRYRPDSLRRGAAMSIVSIVASGLLLWTRGSRKEARRA